MGACCLVSVPLAFFVTVDDATVDAETGGADNQPTVRFAQEDAVESPEV